MLPKDTLELVKKLCDDANPQQRVVMLEDEPEGVYGIVQADGEIDIIRAKPANDSHSASDLETVVEIASGSGTGTEIWINRNTINARYGDGVDLVHRVFLDLKPSPQLAKLAEWEQQKKATLTQRELIIALRTIFADCFPNHPTLREVIGKVRTTKASEAESAVSQGKISIGRKMIAEMGGVGEVPEEITLSVPVFAAASLKAKAELRICIDPDPAEENFVLIVLPGQTEKAFAKGEEWLQRKVADLLGGAAHVSVYHGTP